MFKKLLLMLTLFMWVNTMLTFADYNNIDEWWLNLNLSDTSSSDGGAIQPSTQNVKSQYDVLKQVLSPIWWSVFYDVSKISIFLLNRNEVYKALWANNQANKNFFTQLMWWTDGKSFAVIDKAVKVKASSIILALILITIFGYSLWMAPITWEALWGGWNLSRWHNQQAQNMWGWMGSWMWGWMWMQNSNSGMGQQTQWQQQGWTITLWALITKLQEMMKLTNQDPTIAKLAKQNLWVLAGMLVLTISLWTAIFDAAITQLANLKPLYYFISSMVVVIIFFGVIYMYVKIVFGKLAKFVTNTEEVTANSLFSDLLIKWIGGALVIWLIGGALWILTALVVS